ncbi:MAG: alginate lyase family protein, partial [Candidatus Eisenbacteria bacterium]
MSPAELAWRVGQRARLAAWARRSGLPAEPLARPAGGFRPAFVAASEPLAPGASRPAFAAALEAAVPGETGRVVERSDAVRAGRLELFARTYEFGPDPARWPWNRSPDGGPPVDLSFGPTLDYRDPARVGDARLAWELGRHGYLVPVAQAGYLTGDPGCARFVFETLEAWIEACPPYRGLQWASALEYGLRSLSWGFALALVARSPGGEDIDDARWERVFATWAEQLRFVDAHDARHSSANNHRLGEAVGLAWGGRLLAFVPEAARWHERGLRILEESFLEQTTAGGTTREHAFAYQHFVLDFVLAVYGLESRAGQAPPPAVIERIARVAAMLERVSPGGSTWPVGDGDEGQALPTGEPFAARVPATLECAAALTGEPWPGPASARARWLGTVPMAGAAPEVPAVVADAGYVIAQQGEARLLFDAAELGLAPLYAHGHADALMVLLDVRGPRLVDPGTGGYHARAELRERLRATAAHNTVEVDGVSQSTPGGLFQWLRAASIVEPVSAVG